MLAPFPDPVWRIRAPDLPVCAQAPAGFCDAVLLAAALPRGGCVSAANSREDSPLHHNGVADAVCLPDCGQPDLLPASSPDISGGRFAVRRAELLTPDRQTGSGGPPIRPAGVRRHSGGLRPGVPAVRLQGKNALRLAHATKHARRGAGSSGEERSAGLSMAGGQSAATLRHLYWPAGDTEPLFLDRQAVCPASCTGRPGHSITTTGCTRCPATSSRQSWMTCPDIRTPAPSTTQAASISGTGANSMSEDGRWRITF